MRKFVTRGVVMLLALVGCLALIPSLAFAQAGTTGSIAGVVKDATGAVLPGVTVEAASPALIEKVRTVVTDGEGNYTIIDLRPGTYTVTFTLPGFSTVRREGVELNAGFTANINADLRVGGVEETITVSGATPVVDVQSVRSQNVLTRQVLDTLPTSRSVAAMAAITLGALTTGQSLGGGDAGGSKADTVFGFAQIHGSMQGIRTIDGMKMSSAYNVGASTRNQINQMIVQEISLETAAASAETESSGLNLNMVPKDGGNAFHATGVVEYTNDGLQSNNLNDTLRARGLTRANNIQKIYDYGFGVGGPIKQDKVWFYGAARDWGSIENLAGVYFNKPENQKSLSPANIINGGFKPFESDLNNPAFYDRYTTDGALRLTWQVNQKHKLAFTGNVQDYCWCYSYFITNAEAAWDFHVYPNNNWMATWNYTATNRLFFTGGVSLRQDRQFNGIPKLPDGSTNTAIPILDLATGIPYGSRYVSTTIVGDTEWGDMGNQYAYQTKLSMSYVTGSHNIKVGEQSMTGWNGIVRTGPLYPYQYIVRGSTPVQIKQGAYPHHQEGRLKYQWGFYGMDTWTIRNITLNLGLRVDLLRGYNPPQTRPGGQFLGPLTFGLVDNVPNWKDVSPRVGVAWNVFGDGKTAIKASWGKYVNYETTGITKLTNPANALVANTTRSWNDANGNFFPDCNLNNGAANGECGAFDNRNFGTSVITTRFAKDVTEGWNVRPWNKQMNVVLQQELKPGLGVTAGYYRTWYGNRTIADNLLVTPSDFTPYCVTAPSDSRLPGGGGYQVCNIYNINPNKFGQQDLMVVRDDDLTEVFQGVDIAANWRFGRGGLLNGGVSFGQTKINNCGQPDAPGQSWTNVATAGGGGVNSQGSFCDFTWPWRGQTQIKVQYAYPLPYDFKFSGTYLGAPGLAQNATRAYTNAEITPSLGRPLAGGVTTAAIQILAPNTNFEKRYNQFDIRFSRVFRFGRASIEPRFDVYNLTNEAAVIGSIAGYGPAWLRPTDILTARLVKFGVQVDF
jgi:hypothetical protein